LQNTLRPAREYEAFHKPIIFFSGDETQNMTPQRHEPNAGTKKYRFLTAAVLQESLLRSCRPERFSKTHARERLGRDWRFWFQKPSGTVFRSKLVHKAQILGTADALSSPEKTDAIILGSDQA
jgi:hypothetical protein